jgi:hypothetical protein
MLTFSSPYHRQGYISRCLLWIRAHADESIVKQKYNDVDLSMMLMASLDQILTDLYTSAECPPLSRYNVTVVPNQRYYMLPPNVSEIHRVSCIDQTTGVQRWEIIPENKYSPYGPGILFNGLLSFELLPIWTSSNNQDILTIEYVANGQMMFHQNATPVYMGAGDTGLNIIEQQGFALFSAENTGWFLGIFDRRPNAFLGQRLRVLGTVRDIAPVGYPFFPVQERMVDRYYLDSNLKVTPQPSWSETAGYWKAISTYPYGSVVRPTIPNGYLYECTTSPYGTAGSSEPAWGTVLGGTTVDNDINWIMRSSTYLLTSPSDQVNLNQTNDPRTYLIYEVVPEIDPAIFWLAALDTAIQILTIEKRYQKIAGVQAQFERKKRAAQLRWSNVNMRNPSSMTRQSSLYMDDYET